MKLEWFGNAGHLCVGHKCRFHLCTLVNDTWLVSTVGEYYNHENKLDEIGYGRKYETMVFAAGKRCVTPKCMCGLPEATGSELDFMGYNTANVAAEGHMALVKKWSRKRGKKIKLVIGTDVKA